jgi:hypothetical protein
MKFFTYLILSLLLSNTLILFANESISKGKIFIIDGENGSGTGFSVEIDGKSFVCTNQHVIAGETNFVVRTLTGDRIELSERILFPKDARDVILLETKNTLNCFKVSPKIRFDEVVNSFGNSAGESVITKKTGKIIGIGQTEIEYDNPTVMGDSGSPVINQDGKIVCVVTRGLKEQKVNAWLEDRPDMHTRRFGTRIDNVIWIESSRTQLKRLSLIYQYVMPIIQKWVTAYKQDIGGLNHYIAKSKEMVLPLPKNEIQGIYESPWRKGFWDGRDFKFFNTCPRATTRAVSYDGIIRTELDIKTSSEFEPIYNRNSITLNQSRMLSPIDNWYSDYRKFMALGLAYQYRDKINSINILEYVFFKNLISDLIFSNELIAYLPTNWMAEEMHDEINLMLELTKGYFKKLDAEDFDILYYLGDRENMTFSKDGGKFLHQLSNSEILFMFYYDHQNSKKRSAFVANQPIFDFFDFCLDPKNGFRKDDSIVESRKLLSRARHNRNNLINKHPTSKTWNFDQKLKTAVKSSKANGLFPFLGRMHKVDRAYFQYKTLSVIQNEIEKDFKLMNEDFYNQTKYDFGIKGVCNLAGLFHSEAESNLFKRLKNPR